MWWWCEHLPLRPGASPAAPPFPTERETDVIDIIPRDGVDMQCRKRDRCNLAGAWRPLHRHGERERRGWVHDDHRQIRP